MALEDIDGFFNGNLAVCRWPVSLAVKFRVVRFIFLEDVVDGSQQHSGNSDDRFFVPPTLFECKVTASNFRELLGADSTEGALHKQRLDVDSGSANSGSFLLTGTFVVLRRKTSLRAEML